MPGYLSKYYSNACKMIAVFSSSLHTDGVLHALQVANKVAEIVMTLDGKEVCCQSDDAKARIDRVAADVETD